MTPESKRQWEQRGLLMLSASAIGFVVFAIAALDSLASSTLLVLLVIHLFLVMRYLWQYHIHEFGADLILDE